MQDRQFKPQRQNGRGSSRNVQKPVQVLSVVWTLDGVAAEPLLSYKDAPEKSSLWSKSRQTVMPADHDLPPAGQRHQAHVQQIIQSAAPQLGTHQQQVAHAENLKQVAQRQEHSVEAAADAPQSLVRKDRER